ncbi:hypothetical protein ACQP1G_21500 [Nocardia sp. CA-107356]|uniref:hypothetical protein n=1 Tax=Nocardia sp. CA-107356 TaxID=3239972 RepID=UPI003D8FE986
MSRLSDAATDYLRLRNRLGHDLAEYHRLLSRFVAYLDQIGASTVTTGIPKTSLHRYVQGLSGAANDAR